MNETVRTRVRAVVDQVRGRPEVLPTAALIDLAQDLDMDLTIDLQGQTPIVYTSARRSAAFATLSPRELAVAELVAAGRRNRQIAAELFISEATVKDHLHAVYTKTGLDGRTAVAAAWAGRRPNERT